MLLLLAVLQVIWVINKGVVVVVFGLVEFAHVDKLVEVSSRVKFHELLANLCVVGAI